MDSENVRNVLYWLTVAVLILLVGFLAAQAWTQSTSETAVRIAVAFAETGRGAGV